MTDFLVASGSPGAPDWLAAAAKCGEVPFEREDNANEVQPGDLGEYVKLKCDDVTARLQLIEHLDSSAEEFWALPSEVVQAAERASDELVAVSERHNQHASIGYERVPREKRPTYAGSAAANLALDAGKKPRKAVVQDDDSSNWSDSTSSSPEESQPIRGGTTRRRQHTQNAPETTSTSVRKTLSIVAVQGSNEGKEELWFGLIIDRGRIQWLQEVADRPGFFEVLTSLDAYSKHKKNLQHTFKDVVFEETTTRTLRRSGKKQKTDSKVETITTEALPPEVLASLRAKLGTDSD